MKCYNNDMITATLLDTLIQSCLCCSVLQCVATCCRVLQCVAVCVEMCCNPTRYVDSFPQPRSSVLHCVLHCALHWVAVCCSMLQCVATCCSVLQHAAVCCNVLQCVVVCCSVFCSVLQCVALLWLPSHGPSHSQPPPLVAPSFNA